MAEAQRELDGLVLLARGAEPPPLGAPSARQLVRHAQIAALQRDRRRQRVGLCLLCAAALVAGFLLQTQRAGTSIVVDASDRPLRVALRTGDGLLLAPGSELRLMEQSPARRRVQLKQGRALFDVVKLGAAQGFEVEAGGVKVRVLGTVFSVDVGEGRTLVRVYEGRVGVGGRVVAAPGTWASRGAPPHHDDALFEREAQQLTLARHGAPAAPAGRGSPLAQPLIGPAAAAAAVAAQELLRVRTPAAAPAASETAARALASSPQSAVSAPAAVRGSPVEVASARASAPDEAAAQARSPSVAPVEAASAGASSWAPELPEKLSATSASERGAPLAIARARGLLAAGDARGALELARDHAPRDDEALMLMADASRALGRHREARASYHALAQRAADPLRTRAAFAAAQLAFHALGDPGDALSLIWTFALAADRAPLRERASALEVEALLALGRRREARLAAQRYLAREPETATSRRMRELLGE